MTDQIAVIGDIHGNSDALSAMLRVLRDWKGLAVFAGDYVNRGPNSAEVIQLLVDFSVARSDTVFIAGNHDLAFREALASGEIFPFLSMGGAMTVKSYIRSPKGNVGEQLRKSIPMHHVEFLDRLHPWFVGDSLAVAHDPSDPIFEQVGDRYRVYGHIPTADRLPRVGPSSAAIDTGCGSFADGRLTCFLWPDRSFRQVSVTGEMLDS
ncbi:metallophosphoesterase [Mycolicibacterium sp. CBMA 226]|uniref:metallophosphoesterase n=1 Tax=Mycolicibacterium sp. CBMA 226 TaxID=2606611 RepID=UPI0012DCC83E|nr:metallophosphoesterase [Mycolicibacterium sp. CBMA 226]MUL77220.1 serine/threonine protein phosphatase [Mycolicibacterium sp. CBMA 226]